MGDDTKTLPVIFHGKHKIHVSSSVEAQQQAFRHYLNSILESCRKKNSDNKIVIGFSGGSMPKFLAPLLSQLTEETCERLCLFPVDERLVPLGHEESNAGQLVRLLPSNLSEKVLHLPDDLLDNSFRAAQQFERQLHRLDPHIDQHGFPVFDLLLLGIGPDGHTCSLFPGHQLLNDRFVWVSYLENSPKPPPRRITVTLPVLDAARNVAFIANGATKADVIKQIVADNNQQFPPSRIALHNAGDGDAGTARHIEWFIDAQAAAKLTQRE